MIRALLTACLALTATSMTVAQTSYIPHRVFDTGQWALFDFEGMLADLSRADVVFLGEQHDDPNTHRLELAVLEGLTRRRAGDVVLSLEMFERDTQANLDRFLAGELAEDAFLKDARPWPRYATDYKPLVDFARANRIPVIAANVPRPIASEVSKGGVNVLASKPEADRALFASELRCPTDDEYFKRFGEAMGGHPAEGADSVAARQMTERFYQAQCVKDETMAESIAKAHAAAVAAGRKPLVIHVNGAFHSDFALGTASRVSRRLTNVKVLVVSVLPIADMDQLAPTEEDRRRGNYLVYTRKKD
ncbi:MAG TPA: ChaN family lipoprotein [Vicinamibacterales bacterium]|nr:ChaN family lipoprotein [Vicinamibacterales bacterium]